MDDDVEAREKIFHNAVREYIIWGLLFVLLYVTSYAVICAYKRRAEKEDYYSAESEDALVYRTSLWLCTFTLAVCGGAILLLPISILANEALIMFPNSYYLKWVNSSLIHGLWNYIFLCSNLALFVLMPFAYLFTESEGLPGYKKGIMSRVYETTLVLFLLTVLVCGLAWVVSAIMDNDRSSRQALFDIWDFYLPYLYSCISLLGVVMLLICTPVGFARIFTVIGEMVVKPKFLRDVEEELHTVRLEEQTLLRRLINKAHTTSIANGHSSQAEVQARLDEAQHDRAQLEKRQQASALRRNVGYPLVMLLLLLLTCISVFMVTLNTLELLIGAKALPVATKEIVLGIRSLSALGPVGALFEIGIILYVMLASLVGFYSLPGLRHLQPRPHNTPMTKVIANCVSLVVLSSALPVLSRTLGITNFDLLGDYGRLEWLGNFYIVLFYNLVFAVATAICLVTKVTATVRHELYDRLVQLFSHARRSVGPSSSSAAINGLSASHLKDD